MKPSSLLIIALLVAAPLAAQGNAPQAGVRLSGFAEVSYSYSTRSNGDSVITGRLYDRFHDHFMLNALGLVLDRPYDAARFSAGVHGEALFGQNATVIKSGGFELGAQGDLPQLYVTLNVPTASGNGLQVKMGRMPTLMGLEVIETIANPNWSEGNQFTYVENFTGVGVSVETKFTAHVDAQLRLFNGWDQVHDNNTGKSLMGRVGISPDTLTSIALVGFWGPEETAINTAGRSGAEVLASRKLGDATLWLQADGGYEARNAALADPTQAARWWAVGAWVTYDVTPTLGAAFRVDYVNDENGARTSGFLGYPVNTGHEFGSGTATLNIRTWPNALVRPELRFDHSSLLSFASGHSQLTVALSVAYLF